jgi:hypothetical protein
VKPRRHTLPALTLLILVTAACGSPATDVVGGLAPESSTTTTATETTTSLGVEGENQELTSECPVTIPPHPGFLTSAPSDVTYSEHFPAPDPWPSEYPHEGMVWYGSEDLWTALPTDSDYGVRKSVWWSANFPGGMVEEQPDVVVTWTRIDTEEPVILDNGGDATNAFTPEEGWFMIAGIDPAEAGCWRVEATYKGASLSYVYEMTD